VVRNAFGQRVPDILDCLAQLSNDEVPTPPKLANAMLDLLPAAVWSDPGLRWLDPSTKSGVFLREAASRLLVGLADWQPDFDKRRDHIFRNMLYGTSITEMTGHIARRSLYYSKDASGDHSVVRFADPSGNVPFVYTQHLLKNGRCTDCGAPEALERGEGRENHAYSFIHGAYPTEDRKQMEFDVIVGNPPFQLDDGGHNASATPIFQRFVATALDMRPRYVVMITPSRWFAGGKGLERFRGRLLRDRRMQYLVDYPKLYDGFPGVKIRGGVSYFLWNREHDGPCTIQTMWDGKAVGEPIARFLDAYDVLVRRNEAVSILDKVRAHGESTLDLRVSSMKPFGFRTYFHGADSSEGLKDPVRIHGSQRISWVERAAVLQNASWIDDWKVLTPRVQGTSAAVETLFLSRTVIAGPGEACTETYLVAGRFDSEVHAERYATYLHTRFARFLISLRKSTQDAPRGVYAFIPDLPLDRTWTDAALYKRYDLSPEEIAFIESQVAELPATGSATKE
jgi:hypothetical protein